MYDRPPYWKVAVDAVHRMLWCAIEMRKKSNSIVRNEQEPKISCTSVSTTTEDFVYFGSNDNRRFHVFRKQRQLKIPCTSEATTTKDFVYFGSNNKQRFRSLAAYRPPHISSVRMYEYVHVCVYTYVACKKKTVWVKKYLFVYSRLCKLVYLCTEQKMLQIVSNLYNKFNKFVVEDYSADKDKMFTIGVAIYKLKVSRLLFINDNILMY
jgi:hypothetical protein